MGLGEREGYPDDLKILVSATVGELPSLRKGTKWGWCSFRVDRFGGRIKN